MEKLSRLLKVIILFNLCIQPLNAQNRLCIYNTKGSVVLEENPIKKEIKKGDFINKKDNVKVADKSQITALDESGQVYLIDKPGNYNFDKLLLFRKKEATTGLTSKYFKLVWQEMTQKGGKKVIGAVYRGNNLMLSPKDSAKVKNSKITLRWKADSLSLNYVFIRKKESDEVLKLATNGSGLVLFNDNPIFQQGTTFEWTVSKESFPNLNNLPFYTFTLVDRNKYKTLKDDYKSFIDDLKASGLDDEQINNVLCERFGLCE
ncbi:hypothetical protein SAMN05443549_102431 [Flavobacterium fluvii]|uniref:Uncharacterized protein n=1 Tax=Flavobacterium fluvii TaxID=468056 RepID=A0A1M5HY10_9FLAO|nr:hypothetical protein [Flavobacterium fluvii]SHG20772.1 hypothetical protein SAMN05443549_102431 [Flavobacterium fluvii]